MSKTYESSQATLEKHLRTTTGSNIADAILMYMDSARTDSPLYIDPSWSQELQHTIQLQNELGSRAFIHGFLVAEWEDLHSAYLQTIRSSKSAEHWVGNTIRLIWDVSWDLWRFRCSYAHGSEEVRQLLLTADSIDDRITNIYNSMPPTRLLNPTERRALQGLPETKVRKLRLRAKIQWADKAERILQNYITYGVCNPSAQLLRSYLGG